MAGATPEASLPAHLPVVGDVSLFVPLTSRFISEFKEQLLSSLQLFQPFSAPITLVMDDERAEDHQNAIQLQQYMSSVRANHSISFAQPAEATYHSHGHTRQQLLMFWADNFTTAEYIGFVDTDTVFYTRVVDSDLFDGPKPRIIGLVGRSESSFWSFVPPSTLAAVGQPEVMRCMTYFPVVIKRVHLQQLRKYVEALHGKSFDEAFRNFSTSAADPKTFSQFNIMCNYLWYHHRDEYAWSLQRLTPVLDGNGEGQVSFQEMQQLLSDPQLTRPVPRISIHVGHTPGGFVGPMLRGFCLSGGSTLRPELCSRLPNRTQLQREMFEFEFDGDWSWDQRCFDSQIEHYKAVDSAPPLSWNLTLVDALAKAL